MSPGFASFTILETPAKRGCYTLFIEAGGGYPLRVNSALSFYRSPEGVSLSTSNYPKVTSHLHTSKGETTYQHLQNPRAICPMPTMKPLAAKKRGGMAVGQNALVAHHRDQGVLDVVE
jgi:hypothetical protein